MTTENILSPLEYFNTSVGATAFRYILALRDADRSLTAWNNAHGNPYVGDLDDDARAELYTLCRGVDDARSTILDFARGLP